MSSSPDAPGKPIQEYETFETYETSNSFQTLYSIRTYYSPLTTLASGDQEANSGQNNISNPRGNPGRGGKGSTDNSSRFYRKRVTYPGFPIRTRFKKIPIQPNSRDFPEKSIPRDSQIDGSGINDSSINGSGINDSSINGSGINGSDSGQRSDPQQKVVQYESNNKGPQSTQFSPPDQALIIKKGVFKSLRMWWKLRRCKRNGKESK